MDQKELIDRLRRDPNAVQSLMTSADAENVRNLEAEKYEQVL